MATTTTDASETVVTVGSETAVGCISNMVAYITVCTPTGTWVPTEVTTDPLARVGFRSFSVGSFVSFASSGTLSLFVWGMLYGAGWGGAFGVGGVLSSCFGG